jgi:hypothetical protein
MDQADDGLQAEPAELFHPLIGPGPRKGVQIVGRGTFPKNRIAKPAHAELRQSFQIF